MNQKGNKIQTRAGFESFICNCVKILPVWIRQKRNMIKMKSWFLAHNLCWIPTFFPMKYTKLLQINLSCFTSKYFFHCWSKKRETISKWKLVLRLSFVIMSYLTSYDFFQSFILVFLVRIFYLFKWNKKRIKTWLFTIVWVWVELKLNVFAWLLAEMKIHGNKQSVELQLIILSL